MPTVGWIVENAVDRFWEAQPLAVVADAPQPTFICERCGAAFHSIADLRGHYNLEHPLGLPALYVRGESLLKQSSVRARLSTTEIELLHCTECEVQADGAPWRSISIEDFKRQFASTTSAIWNIKLLRTRLVDGARACEEYCVRFRIPYQGALDAIDEQFIRLLAREELSHDELATFQAKLPQDLAVREYAAALGDYALGVLLKERRQPPHSNVSFEEFARRMRAAHEVLRAFERPVAIAVRDSIRFCLNDFRGSARTVATEVEPGLRYFRKIVGADASSLHSSAVHRRSRGRMRPICPIDEVSHQILAACSEALPLSRPRLDSLHSLLSGRFPVSEQDLAKIHVICATGHLARSEKKDALPHLRAVQFDPVFTNWAHENLT